MNYILFGAGEKGINALHFLGKERVICFCDNDMHIEGETIEGIPVVSAECLKSIDNKEVKVIITTVKTKNVFDIQKQLLSMGVDCDIFENLAESFFENDKKLYSDLNKRKSFNYLPEKEYLITWDRCAPAGRAGSYFWQDLWAARRIYDNQRELHYDIGSRFDGFIAHLLSFGQRVRMIDIRPLDYKIPGLDFIKADATNLDTVEDNSISSLSALCSLEHFGLGRYGDPIDPEACFKCFDAIKRKLRQGGDFYLSVPIGKECLCFNAHRVFYVETILREFSDMELIEFSTCYRDEYEERIEDIHRYDEWYDHEGDRMGLFWFRKNKQGLRQ